MQFKSSFYLLPVQISYWLGIKTKKIAQSYNFFLNYANIFIFFFAVSLLATHKKLHKQGIFPRIIKLPEPIDRIPQGYPQIGKRPPKPTLEITKLAPLALSWAKPLHTLVMEPILEPWTATGIAFGGLLVEASTTLPSIVWGLAQTPLIHIVHTVSRSNNLFILW